MTTTLVIVGFVLVAAAAIGGGLNAAGVEVAVISSVARQVALGIVGVAMIVAGFIVRADAVATAPQASPVTDSSGRPPTATTSSGRSASPSASSPSPSSRYVPLYKDTAFRMTAPKGCSDSSVAVTFDVDGPKVEMGIATGNVRNPSAGDFFYANCNEGELDTVYVPDNNPFTDADGEPDAGACATKANAQPVNKSLPFPSLKQGMGFCLISQYNDRVVHLKVTQISANHDLAWTATAWADTGSR